MELLIKRLLEDKKLIVFGTGSFSEMLFNKYGFNVSYYVDNDRSKYNQFFKNAYIRDPDIIINEDKDKIIIFIASIYYEEISQQLKLMGFQESKHFFNAIDLFGNSYFAKSYSQEGEDMVLYSMFEGRTNTGTYVDVGAHHPKRFSNTNFFYEQGWSGINIDPLPNSMVLFEKERPRDVNLEIGISNRKGNLTYFIFDEPALNSFNEELSLVRAQKTNYHLIEKKDVPVDTLSNVLSQHLNNSSIDFMSIDVEGYELEVLESNNWERFRPLYLLIESLDSDLENLSNSSVHKYLISLDYRIFAKTKRTCFYKDSRNLEVF